MIKKNDVILFIEVRLLGENDKIVNTSFIILSAYMGVNKLYIFAFSKDVKKPMSLYVCLFDFVFL